MLAALVQLAGAGMMDQMLVRDSLRQMPRWEQVRWLAKRGLPDPYLRDCTPVQDSGLRCIGRWSFGPSIWVDVRATADDTIVFLSRGSGVSVIRFRSQDSLRLDLLSDINSHGLTGRCQVRDTLLYVNSGGVECYDINDLTHPTLLNWLSQPLIYDFFVVDTFLYTSSRDSLRIFSVANPASPRWLGACADSGYVMYVAGGHVYLGHQAGLFILDVSNPASPHRVAAMGFDVLSIWVRDTLLYFGTTDQYLKVYNVRTPTAPLPVGSLSGFPPYHLYLPPTCDTVLYAPNFRIVNIADPRNLRVIGQANPPGWDYCVTVVPRLNYALVADYHEGLAVVGIENPQSPTLDTTMLAADAASDISVQGGLAAIASDKDGLLLVNVLNPAKPSFLGRYDTLGILPQMQSAVLADSFAFVGWPVERMQSVDISEPTRPVRAGVCQGMFNQPQDMVLRDSLVYCAELRRFQIVNVARPRQPALVGSCVLSGDAWDLDVEDTMAYVTSNALTMVSIARPDSPRVVATWNTMVAVDVEDTIAYTYGSGAVWSLNVANPASPHVLDTVRISGWVSDVVVGDSLAYVGGQQLYVINISDPANLRVVGQWTPPHEFRRLLWTPSYLYAACYEAGVCILETVAVGLEEPQEKGGKQANIRLSPSVTTGPVTVTAGRGNGRPYVRLYNGSGASVGESVIQGKLGATTVQLDLSGYPDGVYFVNLQRNGMSFTMKVVKAKRR